MNVNKQSLLLRNKQSLLLRNKYFVIAKNTWEEMLTYRLSFTIWRIRTVLQLVTVYFLWLAILPVGETLLGYTQSLMLTYILGTSFLSALVLSSRSYEIGDDINRGNLSNLLLRPINYFLYWLAKDTGDKAMNIVFCLGELAILFILLRPPLLIQTQPIYLIFTLIFIVLAFFLYFLLNVLFGLIGFWSPEVWAPRFIFMILISFFAGGLFPLDILPTPIYLAFKFSPFFYLLYFPLKIYLGQLSTVEIITGFFIALFWTIILYRIVQFVWIRGLRVYTAYGR